MNGQRSSAYLNGLLQELRALPHETEWLEFKQSYGDPQEIRCASKTASPRNA